MTTTAIRPTLDTFGARLAIIRQRHGWNMKEAALACGLRYSSWRDWELHGSSPRDYLATCHAIADAAGVDLDWLLKGPDGLPRLDSNQEPAGYPFLPFLRLLSAPTARPLLAAA